MSGHGPAHHPAAPGVDYHAQIQNPRPGGNVGDGGDPQLIRAGGRKHPVDHVGSYPALLATAGRGDPAPAADAAHPELKHRSSHALAADCLSFFGQFGLDPRRPIDAPGALVDLLDARLEHGIPPGANRRGALPAKRDLLPSTGHRPLLLTRLPNNRSNVLDSRRLPQTRNPPSLGRIACDRRDLTLLRQDPLVPILAEFRVAPASVFKAGKVAEWDIR